MEDSKPIRTTGAVEDPLNCVSRPATYNTKGKQENQLRAIKGSCYQKEPLETTLDLL